MSASLPPTEPAPAAQSLDDTADDVFVLRGSCACGHARYEIDSSAVKGALTLSAYCAWAVSARMPLCATLPSRVPSRTRTAIVSVLVCPAPTSLLSTGR